MMTRENRVACVQMNSSHDVKQNLLSAKKWIQQAAEQGAQLIVLPEMFAIMGLDQIDKVQHRETITHGPIQDFLHQQAKQHGVWLVGGTIPIASPDHDKVFASSLVFDDQGDNVARYDKMHLFDVMLSATQEIHAESKTTVPGKDIVVISTPFGKLGLGVCYDVRFPEMFRFMHHQGVEIIALPAAFTYTTGSLHWDVLVRARAIENLSYVLAACQTGTHPSGRRTYGHSMIVNPWGEVQSCLPEGEGVIVTEINLEFLHQIREEFPALSHRKSYNFR